MFDVPPATTQRLEWHGDLPLDAKPWHVGLIVGPSGAGKTTIMRQVFGEPTEFAWTQPSVIDDFDRKHSVEAVAQICSAVGFNTIPAWLRPYGVLSNGEKFRVDLARRLIGGDEVVVCDEFTSVVDRQVAQIGSFAVQKYIRKAGRRFVAVTCHYDLEEWLQPDWVLEPATMTFRWRAVRRRPDLACEIRVEPWLAWAQFARFHYLTAELHRAAKCFVLAVDGRPAAFAGVLFRVHPTANDIYGVARLVTLPDFQGLGLAFALVDRVGAAYKSDHLRLRSYPAHPALIRSYDRSPHWALIDRPGLRSTSHKQTTLPKKLGGRPCAVFEYCGPAMDRAQAALILPPR
jgi:ABC-type lipoprotein export system ATPase subunit